MKPDKEKHTDWSKYFDSKWNEIDISSYERFTFNRINKLMDEVENPEERLLELGKIKNAIETAIITKHSWKGIALKRAESAIQLTRDEIQLSQNEKNCTNAEEAQGAISPKRDDMSNEQKIELWINRNIPNSTNKEAYKEVFTIVDNHPDPKGCTNESLLREIHKTIEPGIGDESIKKQLSKFKNSLPL